MASLVAEYPQWLYHLSIQHRIFNSSFYSHHIDICYTIFMFKTFLAVCSHFTFFFSTSNRTVLGHFAMDTWTPVVLKNSGPPLWVHRVRTFV